MWHTVEITEIHSHRKKRCFHEISVISTVCTAHSNMKVNWFFVLKSINVKRIFFAKVRNQRNNKNYKSFIWRMSLTLTLLKLSKQCGNLWIFLPFRFYVKSMVQKWLIWRNFKYANLNKNSRVRKALRFPHCVLKKLVKKFRQIVSTHQ